MELTWEYFVGFVFITVMGMVLRKVMMSDPMQKTEFNNFATAIRQEIHDSQKEIMMDQVRVKEEIYNAFVHNDRFEKHEKSVEKRFDKIDERHEKMEDKIDKILEKVS